MHFDPQSLSQSWPAPSNPRPVVTFGAGSIVRDAHYSAYRKSGIPIAGIYDPDFAKAQALAAEWGVAAYRTVEEAASVNGAIFDLATPPAFHAEVLKALPDGACALIQKPMGKDLAGATEILKICREEGFSPDVAQETMEIQTALSLVSVGAGVSLVPEATSEAQLHGVAYRPILGSAPETQLSLAYRRDNRSAVTASFCALVRARKARR